MTDRFSLRCELLQYTIGAVNYPQLDGGVALVIPWPFLILDDAAELSMASSFLFRVFCGSLICGLLSDLDMFTI